MTTEQETEEYKARKKKEFLDKIAAWKPSVEEQEIFNDDKYWEQSAQQALDEQDKKLGWVRNNTTGNGPKGDGGDRGDGNNKRHKADDIIPLDEPILSVSEALRLVPNTEIGETTHTGIRKVRGMISSMRPVIKMISGVYRKCPQCETLTYERYIKPEFDFSEPGGFCKNIDSDKHEVKRDPKTDEIEYDKDGCMIRERIWLKKWPEYRNASIIELQDQEKFDDLERLQVILFDENTNDIRAGEQVLVTGNIYFEKFSKMDSKINSRLYSHSIVYEARREISLSSMDVNAIKKFVVRHGNETIDELVQMFAPKVIGFNNIKKGLLLCAASCCNDTKRVRTRMHSLLVGDPGQAKSMLAKEITEIVPNSRFESAQNSSGKSLTAIVSKEGRESSTVLRLGPIPFAKEAICGLNELGRMSFDDQAPLLDVMEEGEFSINKHGFNAHIRSPTVIIGSANPTGSKWSSLGSDGRINLDDIPAIKPLLDRFDFMFVIKTSRDEQAIRDYVDAKSKYEDIPVPNYNTYLEKHLMFAKRFNPKMSSESTVMLNEYYVGIAKIAGSPRVRDTIFKTAKMIARLKLKNIVDAEDAKEACQFYNVILNEYDHIVNIPSNPQETAVVELLYTIEAAGKSPILFEDAVLKTCGRNEYVATYIGNDYKTYTNKKLRRLLERLLENSHVKRVQVKPTVLQWISESNSDDRSKSNKNDTNDNKKNIEGSSSDMTNMTFMPRSQVHAKAEKPPKKVGKDSSSDNMTRSYRAYRSYSNTMVVNTRNGNYDVFIGRRCRGHWDEDEVFANPYVKGKDGTQEQVVEFFRQWIHGNSIFRDKDPVEYRRRIPELWGKKLGCPGNCKPGPCHGDVLIELINSLFPPKCYYCNISGFETRDLYETHGIRVHKNMPLYPGPADLEKHSLTPQGMSWEQEIEPVEFELVSEK